MENSIQPAFAVSKEMAEMSEITEYPYGLTKREYFAAKAMQGYCGGEYTGQSGMPVESIAKWAVEMSDALLSALAEKK